MAEKTSYAGSKTPKLKSLVESYWNKIIFPTLLSSRHCENVECIIQITTHRQTFYMCTHYTSTQKLSFGVFFFSSLTRVHYTRRSSSNIYIPYVYVYDVRCYSFIEFIPSSLCYGDFYRYQQQYNLSSFGGANHIFRIKSVETQSLYV